MNEYKQKADELYSRIIRVKTTDVGFDFMYNGRKCHDSVTVCSINGELYVSAKSVGLGDYTKKFIDDGYLRKDDVLHIRGSKNIFTVVKLSAYKDRNSFFCDKIKSSWDRNAFVFVMDMRKSLEMASLNEIFPPDILESSENAYRERVVFLNMSKKYNAEQKDEAIREEKAREDETLSELVDRIEAMGWKVTLTRM